MKKLSLLSLLTLALFASNNMFAQETLKVLFLGNSYIFTNNLPNTLKEVAEAEGKTIKVESIAQGGARFQTYANNPDILAQISEGDYDVLIMQGQSQEVAFPPAQFANEVYPYAQIIDNTFKASHPQGRVVYFMTWGYRYGDSYNCQFYPPFCSFWTMGEELCNNYTMMANDFNSEIAPVGKAWQMSIATDSTIVLHSPDNSHPSMEGTLLSAYVFYNTLFNTTLTNGANAYLQNIANTTTQNNASLACNLENYSAAIEDVLSDDFSLTYLADSKSIQVYTDKKADFVIYNMEGKLVKHGKLSKGTSLVDVKKLQEGAYTFSIKRECGMRTLKFVKL